MYVYTVIYTVERAGGHCLPCVVDIREEAQVEKAVSDAVERFGGIDIVVNNASAIHLSGTGETPMKRYTTKSPLHASINEILVRSLQLNNMFLGPTNPPFLREICKFRVRGHV